MTFAEKLKKLRENKNFTQRELANIVPTSFSTYRRWETEGYTPPLPLIKRLADALDTTVSYLTGETDESEREANKPEQAGSTSEFIPTTITQDRGMLTYKLGNGRELQVPDTPENAVQFWARVDKLIGLQSTVPA